MGFGDELKTRRLEKGLTLRDLGVRAKVDYTYLSKLEAGKVGPPRRPVIERISKALDVPPGELLFLASQDPSASVVEIFQELLSSPEAIKPEQWREIKRIAKDGLDDHYHIRALIRAAGQIPDDEPMRISAKRKSVSRIWSASRGKLGRSLWSLLHLFLRGNVKYQVEGRGQLEKLVGQGSKIVFVGNHQDVTAFIMYLLDNKPSLPGLECLVCLVSDSQDGREALKFLQNSPIRIIPILRPSADSPEGQKRRDQAYRDLKTRFNAAGKGTVAGMVLDERSDSRDRRFFHGAVLLAHQTKAILLPVVARNRLEFVLDNSWDKHRIPVSSGKILIGEPFEVQKGQGRAWREGETQRLRQTLEQLDGVLARSVGPLSIKLRL